MMAIDFISPDTDQQADLIRSNWEKLGYEYWTTRDMVEMWRNPATGHVAEMTTY